MCPGRYYHIGCFASEVDVKARELFGKFVRPNFPSA